jgi:hypothetical protein
LTHIKVLANTIVQWIPYFVSGLMATIGRASTRPMRWAKWSVTPIKRKGQSNDEASYKSPR